MLHLTLPPTAFQQSHRKVKPELNPAPQRAAEPWACLSRTPLGLEDLVLEALGLLSFAARHFGGQNLLLLLHPGIISAPLPQMFISKCLPSGKIGTKPARSSSVEMDA